MSSNLPFTPEQLKDVDQTALAEALVKSGRLMRFLVIHLPAWRPFFHEHRGELAEKERILKQGLDEESQTVVARTTLSYKMILMLEEELGKRLGRYDLLFDADLFLSEQEVKLKRAMESGEAVLYETDETRYTAFENYVFPGDAQSTLDTFQLRLGFGLKFIPPNAVDLKGKDVIDGGGYIGDSALVFGDFSPRKVYAFEPNPEAFRTMQETLRLNGREDGVVPVPMALGKEPGTFTLYTRQALDPGAGLFFREEKEKVEVQCTTIDDFVRKNDLRPGLIKLDTEGCEFDSIMGALETIKEFKPILLIAANHRPVDLFEIKPFLEGLNLGYHLIFRDTAYLYPNGEICLIAYVGKPDEV